MRHADSVVTHDVAALEHLDDGLARLPERQRTVIALHFLAGKTRDEVAVQLGIDVDTVHQHCRRGLQRLRRRRKGRERRERVGGARLRVSVVGAPGARA
jgi:DNA-directed RNA polymerase specialized sigma24 family protein